MVKDKSGKDGGPITIKKYANRRLYNTQTSTYITLDHLAKMIREEVEFQVIDAKTGTDITHTILTQIIMDEEAGGEQMLPTSFLRQLIGLYGNSMQALVPGYLEASMEQFRANQSKLRKAIEESIGTTPLAQLAQRNVEMLKAAASAFRRSSDKSGKSDSGSGEPGKPNGAKTDAARTVAGKPDRTDDAATLERAEAGGSGGYDSARDQAEHSDKDEIAALRAQMAEMQRKLDALSK